MTGFACDAGLRCWWPMLCRSVFALPRDATECAVVGFAYLWYWSVRVPPLSGKVSTKLPSPCLVQLPDLASEPPTKVEVPGTRWDPARPNQLVCYSTRSPTVNLPPTATHSHAKTLGCPSPGVRRPSIASARHALRVFHALHTRLMRSFARSIACRFRRHAIGVQAQPSKQRPAQLPVVGTQVDT